MKRISSKRAKATQISTKVKTAVYDRDNGLCVVCGRPGYPNAHYIPRSAGGLGIEENIVTLCMECHDRFDFGDGETMAGIGDRIREYLMEHYPEWDEEKLVYRKYGGEIDGI